MNNDFLKKEIEEIITKIIIKYPSKTLSSLGIEVNRGEHNSREIVILEPDMRGAIEEAIQLTLKECQKKFKKHLSEFIRKVKDGMKSTNGWMFNYKSFVNFIDKLAKEEFGGLVE